MRRFWGVWGIIGLMAGIAHADITAVPRADIALKPLARKNLTAISHDRSVWVRSTNSLEKLGAMKWAGRAIDRIENMVDSPWRIGKRQLHIRIWNTDSGEGNIRSGQGASRGALIQRLELINLDLLHEQDMDEALCRLLLAAYVVDANQSDSRGGDHGRLAPAQAIDVLPRWFCRGFSENLYKTRRVKNTELVMDAWETGRLPTLATFLRKEHDGRLKDDLSVGYSCLIVMRLVMLPQSKQRFSSIFKHLADGRKLSPEWMMSMFPECTSLVELDLRWDDWMLTQRRRILTPGGLAKRDLERVRQELFVYPGDYGVPMSSDWDQVASFRDLIAYREAPWIPTFAFGRMLSLRTSALGKDKRLVPVVDRYCEFLEALGERKREKKLKRLLDEAEKIWGMLLLEESEANRIPGEPELLPADGP